MQCPKCNHNNPDVKFCLKCGEALVATTTAASAVSEPAPAPAPVAAQQAASASPTEPGPPEDKVAKGGLLSRVPIWLWVVLGVVAAGILIGLLAAGDEEPDGPGDPVDVPPEEEIVEPFTYGDDSDLDALWDGCESGDSAACDDLVDQSPAGSEYADFAELCGGLTGDEMAECALDFP
jgi:hypothetical protein